VFLSHLGEESQERFVPEALERARAYVEAGADCVFPIALHEPAAVASFLAEAPAPVNVLPLPQGPSPAELAELGAARISYGTLIHRRAMEWFGGVLEEVKGAG
jgi:2-methylisocitrate lyase-like PEP mutase family enzyme